MGGRWSNDYRCWVIPPGEAPEHFERWIPGSAQSDHPLRIDLVPETCWLSNLQSLLTPDEWAACEQYAFRKSEYYCDVCRRGGEIGQVGCYETWNYDDATGIQRLSGLATYCHDCLFVKRYSFSDIPEIHEKVCRHLIKVNNWTELQAHEHLVHALSLWKKRSKYHWRLNISWLQSEAGIQLSWRTLATLAEKEVDGMGRMHQKKHKRPLGK